MHRTLIFQSMTSQTQKDGEAIYGTVARSKLRSKDNSQSERIVSWTWGSEWEWTECLKQDKTWIYTGDQIERSQELRKEQKLNTTKLNAEFLINWWDSHHSPPMRTEVTVDPLIVPVCPLRTNPSWHSENINSTTNGVCKFFCHKKRFR